MRRIAVVCITVFALVLTSTTIGLAASKVAVADMSEILDESKAGQRANALLASIAADFQQELAPLEAQLERLAAIAENDDSSAEEKERAQTQFDAELRDYLALVEQYETELDQMAQNFRDEILSDVGVVIQLIGDREDIDVILNASAVWYYRHAVDLTADIIEEYDALWDAAQDEDE